MRNPRTLSVACALAAGLSVTVSAHHSRTNFDQETLLEFEGVLTEYSWRNPHSFATVVVETETGETRELLMEMNSISVLSRGGWTRDTMKAGDRVTVFANPDNNPNNNIYYSNYWVLSDGSILASAPGSARSEYTSPLAGRDASALPPGRKAAASKRSTSPVFVPAARPPPKR